MRQAGNIGSDRSTRLKVEAGNCLALAVRERDGASAAMLIDEAIRLAERARELTRKAGR